MRIPLPKGLRSIPELPKLRESVVNMVRLGEALIPRPGISQVVSGMDPCRGGVIESGLAHFVMGNDLYRYQDGVVTALGEITGTARVMADVGLFGAALVDSGGGSAYRLTSSGLTQVTGEFFEPSRDVAYIQGYYVFVPLDGGPPFFSTPASPFTFAAENFFDAEQFPDPNMGVRNWRDDLYVMGSDSTQLFRTTGNADAPFRPVQGATIPVGLVSAHIEYGPSFVLIGKRKDHSYGIFQMGSGVAQQISNEAVDWILNNEYTTAELETAYANRFVWNSVEVVTFHLPRHTLAFYGDWGVFESGANAEQTAPWHASHMLFLGGQYLVGGIEGSIGTLGDSLTDFGDDFDRGFDTFARSERGKYFRMSSLVLDCLTGQTPERQGNLDPVRDIPQLLDQAGEAIFDEGNDPIYAENYEPGRPRPSNECRVSLQLSDDGRIFTQRTWESLGETGSYQRTVCFNYPGGLGTYESFAGIRIRSSNPVSFALDAMEAEIR